MDEMRRDALTAELQAAIRKRDRLDAVIDYLREALGADGVVTTSAETDTPTGPASVTVPPNGSITAIVSEGEYFGMSGPKATKMLLEKVGRTRPLKTTEIFDAITKGGVKIANAQTLYRSLFRDSAVLRVGKGTWGLAEWYPPSARRAAAKAADAEAVSLGLAVEDSGVEDNGGDDDTSEEVVS